MRSSATLRDETRYSLEKQKAPVTPGLFADQEILVPFVQIIPHIFLYVNILKVGSDSPGNQS